MKIIIKNNPNGKSNSETLVKVTEYFLNKLLGNEANKFGSLIISFKKLPSGIGGRAKTRRKNGIKHYLIDVCKYENKAGVLIILAHECTHIKQYFFDELTTRYETKVTRRGLIRKKVRNWKGREIRRSVYLKRPWEVEARRNEKMAVNIMKKIDGKIEPVTIKPIVAVLNSTREIVISILNGGSIPNGELVSRVLDGNKDKQNTLKVLREVFALKQSGVIQEFNKGSLIYVRRV